VAKIAAHEIDLRSCVSYSNTVRVVARSVRFVLCSVM
jgi:hypothetical protein